MTGIDYNELTKAQLLAVVHSYTKLQQISEYLHEEVYECGAYDDNNPSLKIYWDEVEWRSVLHDAFCEGLATGLVKTGSRSK